MTKRKTLDDVIQLDISYLKKAGYLVKDKCFLLHWSKGGKRVASNVAICARENHLELVGGNIYFTKTPCNYGGERLWFSCPKCGRRSRILYGIDLVCRLCADLPYACIGECRLERMNRKISKFKSVAFYYSDVRIKPKQKHKITHLKNINKYLKYMEIRVDVIREIL